MKTVCRAINIRTAAANGHRAGRLVEADIAFFGRVADIVVGPRRGQARLADRDIARNRAIAGRELEADAAVERLGVRVP